MSDTAGELHRMVLGIVEDLKAAVAGNLYEVDGDHKVIEDLDEWKKAEYEKAVERFKAEHSDAEFAEDYAEDYDSFQDWMEDEIGTAEDVDEPDEVSLSEYLEKQGLGDTRFEVDSSKELQGAKTLFTYGGPNIWVADDEVRGYWGNERVELCLDSDTQHALFSWFEEQWDMIKGGD